MQKRAMLAVVSVLALATAATTAEAATNSFRGWYVAIEGGANFVDDATVVRQVNAGPTGLFGTTDFDAGWTVMGQIGYRWDSGWRMEFELGYRDNDGTFVAPAAGGPLPGGVPAAGVAGLNIEISQFTQMVNVLYDIPLGHRFSLSIGAGIGGNLVDWNDGSLVTYDDDYVLAGQLIAQFNFEVTKRLELFLDYRYFVADDPEFTGTLGANNFRETFDDTKHTVMVGLRFDLQEDEERIVVVQPQQPVALPPEPVHPQQFIVFFGWNKYNLTRQAQETVAQAAAAAQAGPTSVLVVGHTDTSGSSNYNQRLSERRADTVKNELVRLGIDPNRITALGKGETELLVQTADHVREPQNRRVEVNIQR